MYVDAHAHLDKYDTELPEILDDIESNEIFTVSVSMNPESYVRSRKIAEESQWVVTSFGVHPWDAPQFRNRLESLDPLIESSPMLGMSFSEKYSSTSSERPFRRGRFSTFTQKAPKPM
jgi:TatD DNase family protein